MKKIMLACSAGMSTSLLVNKMKEAAKAQGVEAEIWAISEADINSEIAKCDVLLLGPQVRFLLTKAKGIAEPHGIPVDVIDMRAYGMCDGKAVLDKAISMIK